ncbi:Ligand-dependent nuclear receptor-interacting factor 1, partial [Mesitornis unicolor]
SDGQQCQQTPMKWIVQESPQTSAPCLIPVKSSNNVASKILKTLSDTKNVEVSSANILPLCTSGPGGSQTKITPIKDNALVMYNGRVYLLTKRGSDVLSAQADKQVSSDASLNKETSKLVDSATVNKITSKVVNLVLSKNKEVVLSQKDPNPCTNSKKSSPAGLKNDLKSAPATLVTPSANQQNSTVNEKKSLPLTESISSGVTPITAVGTQENVCQNGKEKILSPKAASAVLPQCKQECACSEDWQKSVIDGSLTVSVFQMQCEKMDSPGKIIRTKHQEKPHWKCYLELRRKFGLTKEERVYLKRIPLRTSYEKKEEGNDAQFNKIYFVCFFSAQIIVDLEEELTKKRKVKSSPLSDSGKRRKTSVRSTTSPSSENTSSNSVVLKRSVSPPPVLPQQSIFADSVIPSPERDSEQDPYSQYSDITGSNVSVLVSCEDDTSVLEGSFRDDAFPLTPPDLDETIRDEKIKRLKQLLREREAALEEMRRK